MSPSKFTTQLASLAIVSIATVANAEPTSFTLDKGHAYVGFEVDHMGYARTVGEFRQFDGTFTIDEEDLSKSTVTFTIDAASVDSNHKGRDDHLRNADYLDVENHPTITFKSTGVTMLTPESGKLHGDLTLLGVTRPLILDFNLVKNANYPAFIPNYDQIHALGFEVTGEILRLDYGMDFVGFPGSPSGLAVMVRSYFDLVDCAEKPETNVPCNWGR